MNKAVVSVRMDAAVRDQFQAWAKEDRRSLGNYLESLFMQECARRKNGDVTLSSLDVKLDRLLAAQVKPTPRPRTNKPSPYDVELFDGLEREVWHRWVDYRMNIQKVPIRYEAAVLAVEQLKEWDDEGYNVEAFIDNAIKEQSLKIFIPYEARKLKGTK